MAHYAFLDENNVVTEVITGKDETELIEGLDPETWYGNFRGQKCVRTSYNTIGGKSRIEGKEPFRKNYAGIGMTYDENRDAFIGIKRFDSWIFNEETCLWEAPIPKPNDGNLYDWDEQTQSWI
jgi:hypothetical protein